MRVGSFEGRFGITSFMLWMRMDAELSDSWELKIREFDGRLS